jgi:hypothetical protein
VKRATKIACIAAMAVYLTYRSMTMGILMLAVRPTSGAYLFYCALYVLAFGVFFLSLINHERQAVALALVLCLAATLGCWVVICGKSRLTWGAFGWWVMPEIGFLLAVTLKQRAGSGGAGNSPSGLQT